MSDDQLLATCGNCGHFGPLVFHWLGDWTSLSRCACCGSTTIQRAHMFDDLGRPIRGEFLVIKTINSIKRGG